jgi:hypothetical protein
MTTIAKFYWHAATSGDAGTLPTAKVSAYVVDGTSSTANTNMAMDATKGASQASSAASGSAAGHTAFNQRFVSAPIAAQTISGTVTVSVGEAQAQSTYKPQFTVYLALWRPSTGAKVGDLYSGASMSQGGAGTTEQALSSGALTLTSQTALDGDIIVVEVYGSSNYSSDTTCTTYYDGTTESSTTSNAAFANFSAAVTMYNNVVTASAATATGTGAALDATVIAYGVTTAPAATATGTGAALQPTVSAYSVTTAPAATATGTGAALNATVSTSGVNASAATATGTGAGLAPSPHITPSSGLPAGTGAALAPTATLVTQSSLATGTGAALDATVNIYQTPPPTVTSTAGYLEVSVWDGYSTITELAILDGVGTVKWTDVLGDVGSGSCELSAYDPKVSYVSEGNLIKVSLGGQYVFGWFIEAPVLQAGEAADFKWTLAGSSVLSYLDYAVVYPSGWPSSPTGTSRPWSSATFGTILNTLLSEAQGRGTLGAMTWDFTTSVDSQGSAWTANSTLSINNGTSYLDVVKKFVALGMGVNMDPNLVLHAYVPGGQGSDLTGSVVFRQGYHIRDKVIRTGIRSVMKTVALVEGSTPNYVEASDAAYTGNPYVGRRESFLDYSSTTNNTTTMTVAGNQQIALTESAAQAIVAPLTHGNGGLYEPYRDYRLGDTVALDIPGAYSMTALQVVGLTVAQTPGANYIVNANLGGIALPYDLRIQQQLASNTRTSSNVGATLAGNLTLGNPK